ncbi:unnamed protein product [Orchesella dallaii]|uniref:Uncharacterized protein n=1 Tax=Orchesella dallaii TaxID=48710 RepID=A0ABP1QV40_9HEXA
MMDSIASFDIDYLVRGNAAATPVMKNVLTLHNTFFGFVYPFPFKMKIENGMISLNLERLIQWKFIPFYVSEILITAIIGFGSCFFLLILELFNPQNNTTNLNVGIFGFLGSASLLEWGSYIIVLLGQELILIINHQYQCERIRKKTKTCQINQNSIKYKYNVHNIFLSRL